MLKSILLPLDGSESSAAARDWAIRLGKRFGARITGLGILDEPTITRPEATPIGGTTQKVVRDQARLTEAEEQIRKFLDDAQSALAASGLEYDVLEVTGIPYEQIVLEAQRHDLIVMGNEPHFHFETQDTPGETLARTVEAAPRPIFVVPKAAADGNGCLIAYDGRPPAARALQSMTELGLCSEPPVNVVVIHDDAAVADQRCKLAIDYLTRHDVHARPKPIATGEKTAKVLFERVAELKPAWVCIGAHGGRKLRRLFLGSVCNSLIQTCPAPLFIHH
jgi:nucleotide-binding universal stress UspA family protein